MWKWAITKLALAGVLLSMIACSDSEEPTQGDTNLEDAEVGVRLPTYIS